MPTLKSIRKRIASVQNTQKVTRAMQMIAAARLRKAQNAAVSARAYSKHTREVALRVALAGEPPRHPYVTPRDTIRRVEYLILTSDRGLCGGFNESLIRATLAEWKESQRHGVEVSATVIGRKGRDILKARGFPARVAHVGFYEKISVAKVLPVVEEIAGRYLRGDIDQVVLVYNRFRSVIAQDLQMESLLPLAPMTAAEKSAAAKSMSTAAGQPTAAKSATDGSLAKSSAAEKTALPANSLVDYIYEPSREVIAAKLIERAVATHVYQACLESVAGEFAARMSAMDNATKNAKEMKSALTMQLNRARQAFITRELLDIVNGAESLKG